MFNSICIKLHHFVDDTNNRIISGTSSCVIFVRDKICRLKPLFYFVTHLYKALYRNIQRQMQLADFPKEVSCSI